MLPTFYCVGTQKAGTTWLYDCLVEHPDVFLPEHKEVNWFRAWAGKPSLYEGHGLAPYERLFDEANGQKARGDISPGLLGARCAEILHDISPDATVIAILRDPAERAHSHYHMLAGRHRMPFDFDELLEDPTREDPHEILYEGYYARHLRPFVERFDRVVVLRFEDLRRGPEQLFEEVCRILEVDPSVRPSALTKKSNAAGSYRVRALYELRVAVAERLARSRFDWIRVALRRAGLPRLVDRLGRKTAPNAPLTPRQRARLQAIYADDVRELEALLGQDFGAWLEPR
ncbi:MAG: sulfotransferase [Sandaracinaceae bacterium]|nr:sulfotransferase [Sandaracinaceae bacterium]